MKNAQVWWVVTVVAVLVAFLAGTCTGGGPVPEAVPVSAEAEVWTCAMHPQIRQEEPGSCPLCGMDLVTAVPAEDAGDEIVLSPRAQVLARLETTPVRRQTDAAAGVRLLGRVEPAESMRRNITTWMGGRIDRLQVNTTGERVRRGQVIAALYSPEVYAAHQDLITARGQVERLAGATASARGAAEAALGAAKERLRLLGVPNDEIVQMSRAAEPVTSIAIRSPFGGTVIERVASEGQYVQTGATLYRIADLGTLWVQLDAYERDLTLLAVGQTVALEIEALPGRVFEGRIDFIDPTVDALRRTARVRVVVENEAGALRPGMFAEAVVQVAQQDASGALVIPDTAPLFTGRRSLVYVETQTARGPGYTPRTVRLGPRLGPVYPVVSGLSEGERVVSRGAFVLDADLQIRGGAAMMTRADDRAAVQVEPVALLESERAPLAPVLQRYLEVQRALAEDDLVAAVAAGTALRDVLGTVVLPARAGGAWSPVEAALQRHAAALATAPDIAAARGAFEPLSASVELLLEQFGNPLSEPVHIAFCPMAMENRGARWVQAGTRVDNAYFGDMMRTCGELQGAVEPGAYLDGAEAP